MIQTPDIKAIARSAAGALTGGSRDVHTAPKTATGGTGGTLRRRGFTFAEILFAVMILGIGFIMIAGVFPVALQQAQLTRSDAAAASVSEAATRWLINNNNVLHVEDFPAGGGDFFGPPQLTATPKSPDNLSTWEHLRGNLIVKSDPRYAWTPVVFREQNAPHALVFVFICESQLDASFFPVDVNATTSNKGNLYPRPLRVIKLVKADATLGQLADRITLQAAGGPSLSTLAPGAFVVVKRSPRPIVYRIGNPVNPSDLTLWELMPGYDLAGDNTIPNNGGLTGSFNAYVIGRRSIDNWGTFTGPAQDIGIYQTSVHLTSENEKE